MTNYLSNVAEHLIDQPVYPAGKPIEETAREYGLDKIIKLASNENPHGCSKKVKELLSNKVEDIFLYPDAAQWALKEELSKIHNISSDHIFVGNGSNEAIETLTRLFMGQDAQIHTQEYAFIAYKLCIRAQGIRQIESPVDEKFRPDLSHLTENLSPDKSKMIFLANPNNPTGNLIKQAVVDKLIDEIPDQTLLVIDEAYHEYVGDPEYRTSIPRVKDKENLAVLRTFSKAFGISGLRVGYLIGPAKLVNFLEKFRQPFNVGILSQLGALESLKDTDFVDFSVSENLKEKKRLEEFYRNKGIEFFDTEANFHLVKLPFPYMDIHKKLLERGLILRPMNVYGLPNYVRITIGKAEENDFLMELLPEFI